jgi:hypothetical protein
MGEVTYRLCVKIGFPRQFPRSAMPVGVRLNSTYQCLRQVLYSGGYLSQRVG